MKQVGHSIQRLETQENPIRFAQYYTLRFAAAQCRVVPTYSVALQP